MIRRGDAIDFPFLRDMLHHAYLARERPTGGASRGPLWERLAVVDRELVARPVMTATLTCDHRAVDGAPAAEFLEKLRRSSRSPR